MFKNGVPTGEYQDFLAGFVADDASVGAGRSVSPSPTTARCWSRTTRGGVIWRVAYTGG